MAEYYKQGECIDGSRVNIKAKRIDPKIGSYVVSPTGFKGIKHKCSRDGTSEIIITLSDETTKKALELKPTVHLETGDRLKCNKFFFIAETKRKLNCFNVTMMSGQHECSEGKPDVRVYAEIEMPFESIVKAADKKLNELSRAIGSPKQNKLITE